MELDDAYDEVLEPELSGCNLNSPELRCDDGLYGCRSWKIDAIAHVSEFARQAFSHNVSHMK